MRVTLARAWEDEDRRLQLSQALTASRLRALHHAEDIGSALKRGVNVCQRQLVNEVLGFLVTDFVRNFGREGALPAARLIGSKYEVLRCAGREARSRGRSEAMTKVAPYFWDNARLR
jgi:hypothetical protein